MDIQRFQNLQEVDFIEKISNAKSLKTLIDLLKDKKGYKILLDNDSLTVVTPKDKAIWLNIIPETQVKDLLEIILPCCKIDWV